MTVSYSKKQVDKAGKLLRRYGAAFDGGEDLNEFSEEELEQAAEVAEWWRERHAVPLSRVSANLRHHVGQISPSPVEVTQRLKQRATILDKLQREPSMALSKMEDIAGVRAIVPRQHQVNALVERLKRSRAWRIRRIRWYITGGDPGPKSDGYRAVHVVVGKDGCWVEIQLRTPWQNSWAQSVEQDTRRLRARLKFGGGPDDLREYYRSIAELFELREQDIQPSDELMEDLARRYAETRTYFSDEP